MRVCVVAACALAALLASAQAESAPPGVVSATATLHPDNSLIAEIAVELDAPGRVYVEYHGPAGTLRSATTPEPARTVTVPLVRLLPDSVYRYTVVPVAADDTAGTPGTPGSAAEGTFRTRALPPALARLQKPNHNLVYWEGGPTGRFVNCCLREMDPLGRVVTRLVNNDIDKWAHHDLLILPDEQVLYVAHEIITIDDTEHGGEAETRVLVDSLRGWDQVTHTTEELWDARDHLSLVNRVRWAGDPKNWLNVNSLALGVRGNVILSLANRNEIISIAPDFRSIEWRLGGPESSYEFADPTDRFYFQHTVSELPNGNILLFDNGRDRPEEEGGHYSRALELALNTYDLIAVKVWEYRHTPDLYSLSRSSAYRLPSGNTLINFETNDSDPQRVIVEADAEGAVVWQADLRSPTIRNSYRAYPADTIMGERRAEEP